MQGSCSPNRGLQIRRTIFHEGRLFEFKIMQNTETVKKTQGFRKQTFTHYTKRERPWHKPLLWQGRASMRHIFHPNMSLIGLVLQELQAMSHCSCCLIDDVSTLLLKIKRRTAHFAEQQPLQPQPFVIRRWEQSSFARKRF